MDGAGDLVVALHLLDHQLGVGDHVQALRIVFDGLVETWELAKFPIYSQLLYASPVKARE